MAKRNKSASQLKVHAEPITVFEVAEDGTLRMADYAEAETRAEFYEDVADRWEGSRLGLCTGGAAWGVLSAAPRSKWPPPGLTRSQSWSATPS